MSDEELVINEYNFEQYFFDVRKHKIQKGQVMACYSARADWIDSNEKANVIDLLIDYDTKVEPAVQVMRKLVMACEEDAVRVLREVVQDLLNGMTREEVLKKPYKFTIRFSYYTNREYVPKNDPHWSIIEMLDVTKGVDIDCGGFNLKLSSCPPKK